MVHVLLLGLSLHTAHYLHLLLRLLLGHHLAGTCCHHHLRWLLVHLHHLLGIVALGLNGEPGLLLNTHLLLLVGTGILLLCVLGHWCRLLLLRGRCLGYVVLLLGGSGHHVLGDLELLSAHLVCDLALLLFVVVGDAQLHVHLELAALACWEVIQLELKHISARLVDHVAHDLDDATLLLRGELTDEVLEVIFLILGHVLVIQGLL